MKIKEIIKNKNYKIYLGIEGEYFWSVKVLKKDIEKSLKSNLEVGIGSVSEICIYNKKSEYGGNPFSQSLTTTTQTYYLFKKGIWIQRNRQFDKLAIRLIEYINNVSKIRLA